MTPRRLGLIFSLAGMVALAVYSPKQTEAQGQAKDNILPTFQSEGRDPIYFSTACISTAWRMIISSDTIARSTLVIASSSNTALVCISTGMSSANGCAPNTASDELPPASAMTLYHRASIFCRSASGTQTLKGHRNRDHADYGNINMGAP